MGFGYDASGSPDRHYDSDRHALIHQHNSRFMIGT